MAGNSELLTIHDATWEGNGNAWEMQKCIVCLDEHLLRQIDGKFGSQIKRYYQIPWWLFRSVIPWFIT